MRRSDPRTILQTPREDPAPGERGRSSRRPRRWLKADLRPKSEDNARRSARGGLSADTLPSGRVGATSPSIASLIANPSTAAEIPTQEIPALIAKLASEQATLSALQGLLTARLLAPNEHAATASESADRLLNAEQVATILGVTKRWVQRRAPRLPFARRLSAHAVRYSESGLKRWMANR